MKVALVHHWLTGMRGGEKVLEALCELFPAADIFTLVCDEGRISEKLRRHRIVTSFIQRLPFGRTKFRGYLPLFPMAAGQWDFSGYDLVLSCDASLVKAVRVPDGTPHVCYCHSPPRYLWDLYELYRSREASAVQRLLMPVVAKYLRGVDYRAAQRVTHFIGNSRAVAERIARHYGREATVVYPPVETKFYEESHRLETCVTNHRLETGATEKRGQGAEGPRVSATADRRQEEEGYYLFVGQLVAYKRADLAVEAMAELGRRLVVVGDGPQRGRLERLARGGVTFAGAVSDERLRELYAGCRALVFPNEEDFGIVPVEAQAAGAPVIALGRGGGLETVVDGVTGVHFADESVAGLVEAVRRFEAMEDEFTVEACRANARRFEKGVFMEAMGEYVAKVMRARYE
ncbi:MAG: glycosyltransferase [Planctomycetes bacterium]|nr:glycosyltransferase [Planctomycetota bacterium]